jgi:hypothetical protein
VIETDKQPHDSVTAMETSDLNSKYHTLAIAALLCGSSWMNVQAQDGSQNAVTGRREILLQTTQSWNGKPYTRNELARPGAQLASAGVYLYRDRANSAAPSDAARPEPSYRPHKSGHLFLGRVWMAFRCVPITWREVCP